MSITSRQRIETLAAIADTALDERDDLRRRLDEAEHEAMALRVERDELREALTRMLRDGGAWTAYMQAIYDEAMGA